MEHLESGFETNDGKKVLWYGLGTPVNEAPTSEDAIRLAGIDWTVKTTDLYTPVLDEEGNPTGTFEKVDGYLANKRDIDGKTLGIVTGRYIIVQNADAFSFTDNLISNEVKYESAGSFANGKRVWLLAKLPDMIVAGENITPYIAFTNSHDGKGSIRVSCIPIQQNSLVSLNFNIPMAPRQWAAKHLGKVEEKIEEANRTLEMTQIYLENLSVMANQLIAEEITDEDVQGYIDVLLPLPSESEERKMANVEYSRKELIKAYNHEASSEFFGTKWGFLNAVSKFVNHTPPLRYTATFAENRFARVIDGHWFIDNAFELLTKRGA